MFLFANWTGSCNLSENCLIRNTRLGGCTIDHAYITPDLFVVSSKLPAASVDYNGYLMMIYCNNKEREVAYNGHSLGIVMNIEYLKSWGKWQFGLVIITLTSNCMFKSKHCYCGNGSVFWRSNQVEVVYYHFILMSAMLKAGHHGHRSLFCWVLIIIHSVDSPW